MFFSKKEFTLLLIILWAIMLLLFWAGFLAKNIFAENYNFVYLIIIPLLLISAISITSLNAYLLKKYKK